MKNISKICFLPVLAFAIVSHAAFSPASAKYFASGIPDELKGFRGMMSGKLIEKKQGASFVFRVDRIMKTWKANKAENARKAVGKTIVLSLEKVSKHHGERIMKNYKSLKNGDQIEVEAFDLGSSTLNVKEWLKKAPVDK
ncbi:MAG: hypothetical protein HN531_13600 [Opitutae bacterium]|nr:hypothetical protein [Opitutae bacterium]